MELIWRNFSVNHSDFFLSSFYSDLLLSIIHTSSICTRICIYCSVEVSIHGSSDCEEKPVRMDQHTPNLGVVLMRRYSSIIKKVKLKAMLLK